jgi:D-alanine-D-alanine ligase
MKPKKVWVLYGGESVERDVSIKSGTAIATALKNKGFEVREVDFKSRSELPKIFASERPDIVYLGLHGTFGEDGTLQGYLETLGIPYTGSRVLSSATSMNKLVTQKLLKHHGLPIAKFVEATKNGFLLDATLKEISLAKKWFIKAASQGSTLGVFRYDPALVAESERKEAFGEMCQQAFGLDNEIIIEEWIEGRELSIPVVNGTAYPIIEIKPNSKYYDYKSKYTAGQTEYLCPAPVDEKITKKVQQVSEAVFHVMKCLDYARVDVMLKDSGEFYVLEINTLPGMTATSLVPKAAMAKGISFEDFVEMIVTKSYERQVK